MNLIGTPVTAFTLSAAPPARVAVELGEDHAVEFERLVERLGAVDGVLAGHRVADQQRLVRHDLGVDQLQLPHELVVDVQPARRVENQTLTFPRPLGLVDRVAANLQGIALGRVLAVDRHADLLADDLELIDGGRPLEVGGDEHRLDALLLEHPGELAAGGRLSASLQTAHHHDRDPVAA